MKTLDISIIGYGRIGRLIEEVARSRGHRIACVIDAGNTSDFNTSAFRSSDVAIEFSTPATASDNLLQCISAGVPVVCGTTGWQRNLEAMRQTCREAGASMLWSSNFSIGVNIFMALSRYCARVMNFFPQYDATLSETHHIHKLDHPSGTAVTLADDIVECVDRITQWTEPCNGPLHSGELAVNFVRRGEVPGIHEIVWGSESDSIRLEHSATSRRGFALGAVMAAEWLVAHPGVHTMSEMLADTTGLGNVF